MYCAIIEVVPLMGVGAVVDVFSVEIGGSRIRIEVLKLLVVGEPANDL